MTQVPRPRVITLSVTAVLTLTRQSCYRAGEVAVLQDVSAEAAIKRAIREFGIDDPQRQIGSPKEMSRLRPQICQTANSPPSAAAPGPITTVKLTHGR